MPSQLCRVGLFLPPTAGYFTDVIIGVQEFASAHPHWVIEVSPNYEEAVRTLELWRPHGFLFDAASSDEWRALLRRSRAPGVQVGGQEVPGVVRVSTDNPAIGAMAADHFLARGFRNFAFCGYSYIDWALERRDGFAAAVARAGGELAVYPDEAAPLHVRTVDHELREWIEALPKPVAVFACHDRAAMLVGKACELAGVRVPDDVAIVGVDNNLVECFFTNPPLSSVMGSARRIGYEAAILLDAMMRGGKSPPQSLLIPPAGVDVRASTDVLAIEDPDLAAAVEFITEHAGEKLTVEDVADAVGVSRRQLERMFLAGLKRSPKSEIVRAHVERAKALLVSTDQSALLVALGSGFPSASKFATVFKRVTGLSPVAFRKRYGMRRR